MMLAPIRGHAFCRPAEPSMDAQGAERVGLLQQHRLHRLTSDGEDEDEQGDLIAC